MELAINFSYPAAELFTTKQIVLDRFKVPDWPDLIAEASKVLRPYIHFAINAGGNDSQTKDWSLADAMARATETRYVNVHLAPRAQNFAPGDDAAVFELMRDDVTKAIQFFGPGRVIAENIPLGNSDEGFAAACADPAVITKIIGQTGCGFLLDLSHARLAARFLNVDERDYVSAMPLHALRELHLTGLGWVDGRWRDHLAMTEADWPITQWAFERIAAGDWHKPDMVAFEYGGVGAKFAWRTDRNVIAEQIPRLYELVHA